MLCGKKLHHACMNAVSFREASGGRTPASEMERSGIERPCGESRNACLAAAGERLQTRQKKEGGQII